MNRDDKAYFIAAWFALPVMLLVASLCSMPFVKTGNVTAVLMCTVAVSYTHLTLPTKD